MTTHSEAVETARTYYNSDDADRFYATIWGGEDIHIGLYEGPDDSIFDASRRTVATMAQRLDGLPRGARVLDLGSGYGGAARYLAAERGLNVVALNLSEAQNERARALVAEQGLSDHIEVVDGSFEDVPFEAGTFDAAWSQDAILHSGDRPKVLSEVARVLRPGGHFVMTDPMQSDDCPAGVLDPILARIHLESLASPSFYRTEGARLGLRDRGFEDLTSQLVAHYSAVLAETQRRQEELSKVVDPEYIERMKTGLGHWIEGGKRGHLAWGIFHFERVA
jgi:sarcosine/dimethylglycine N-methyltransferase